MIQTNIAFKQSVFSTATHRTQEVMFHFFAQGPMTVRVSTHPPARAAIPPPASYPDRLAPRRARMCEGPFNAACSFNYYYYYSFCK